MRRAVAYKDDTIELLVGEVLMMPPPIVRNLIHRLIDHLDQIDADPDLEDDGCAEDTAEREPENCE